MFPKYWENMYANENKRREVYSDIKITDFYLCKQKANVHMIVCFLCDTRTTKTTVSCNGKPPLIALQVHED